MALVTAHVSGCPMPPHEHPTILLATDFGHQSQGATDYAIGLAAALGGRLVVTHVIDPVTSLGGTVGRRLDQVRHERERRAGTVVAEARAAGASATFLVFSGTAGDGVLEAADAEDADLIVIGSHRRDPVSRLLLGSVSDHVLHHARRPVVLVPPELPD
jgi:nucleotide-binding universal stress UspA family protein